MMADGRDSTYLSPPPPSPQRHTSLQETSSTSTHNQAEDVSQSTSAGDLAHSSTRPRERPRVKFTPTGESLNTINQKASFTVRGSSTSPPPKPLPEPRHRRDHSNASRSSSHLSPSLLDTDISGDLSQEPHGPAELVRDDADPRSERNNISQLSAQERAERLATMVSHSAPGSRRGSLTISPNVSPPMLGSRGVRLDDIPLMDLKEKKPYDDTDEESEEEEGPSHRHHRPRSNNTSEAHHIVQEMTAKQPFHKLHRVHANSSGLQSGQITPIEERDPHIYVPPPKQYRGGVLSSLLKLYDQQGVGSAIGGGFASGPGVQPQMYHEKKNGSSGHITDSPTPMDSQTSSGKDSPKAKHPKWYEKSPTQSTSSLAELISSSGMMVASPGVSFGSTPPNWKQGRPRYDHHRKSSTFSSAMQKMKNPRLEDEIHITVHIAEILSRQRYLIKLCRALMTYGAPTHRLEEYMRMTARVLEIESSYLYLPGTMIISFDDSTTHTTEVKLVRAAQGVDLGKLYDVHDIYKEVVHDVIGVEEATQRLDAIIKAKPRYNKWILVGMYGCASVSVGPFAFGMRPIDMPIAFVLGALLGILQLVVAPRSDLYSNVFEISAAVLTSFIARAFGSIRQSDGTRIFCFAALSQSAIALILPGYLVLTSSLELQSRSIVAGSVRMVYAIIYSLFLGYGITIGTAIYGLIDPNATSSVTCPVPDYAQNNPYLLSFPFVPAFALCLTIINQAKWKQAPAMLVIAFAGYVVNFFSIRRFISDTQVAQTLGALAVGVLANLYSRLRHGVAAAALLPAIFVQVPSGLAATGSLVSGVASADQITGNKTTSNFTVPANSTQAATSGQISVNIGYGMIQVSIGITVGLFLSALIVYPLGKKRSGLFSF